VTDVAQFGETLPQRKNDDAGAFLK